MSTAEINPGLLDAALEISKARRNTLVLARVAAKRKDWNEVDRLLKELVPDEALPSENPKRRVSKLRLLKPL